MNTPCSCSTCSPAETPKHSHVVGLGNNTELRAAPTTAEALADYALQQRESAFRLQDHAQKLVWSIQERDPDTGRRTRSRFTACMKVVAPHKGAASVEYHPGRQRARYGDVVRCDSATCPVCGAIRGERARMVVDRALKAAFAAGRYAGFFTYTLQHNLDTSLETSLDILKDAQQRLRRSRRFRALKRDYGWVQSLRTDEITHTRDNGWHPHRHEVALFSRLLTSTERHDLAYELRQLWLSALHAAGGYASQEHGFNAQWGDRGAEKIAQYVSKWGKMPAEDNETIQDNGRAGLASEMTKHTSKRSRAYAGRSPIELLAESADGDRYSGRLWLEYFRAMKGKQFMVGLKKFVEACGLDYETVQEDVQQESRRDLDGYETVENLLQVDLTGIVMRGQRLALLQLVEATHGDAAALRAFVGGLAIDRDTSAPPSMVAAAALDDLETMRQSLPRGTGPPMTPHVTPNRSPNSEPPARVRLMPVRAARWTVATAGGRLGGVMWDDDKRQAVQQVIND